jgi:hypothetical protein
MMKRKACGIAVAVLMAGLMWTSLSAQPGPGAYAPSRSAPRARGAGFGPCQEDVQRLCADVKPGQGRMARCLREKEAEVSPACREFLKQRRSEFRAARTACADDMKRLCADVRPGQGRVAACLKRHEAELSPECKREGTAP